MSRLTHYIDAVFQQPPPLPPLPGGSSGGGGDTWRVESGPFRGYTWSQLLAAYKRGDVSAQELGSIVQVQPPPLGEQAILSDVRANAPEQKAVTNVEARNFGPSGWAMVDKETGNRVAGFFSEKSAAEAAYTPGATGSIIQPPSFEGTAGGEFFPGAGFYEGGDLITAAKPGKDLNGNATAAAVSPEQALNTLIRSGMPPEQALARLKNAGIVTSASTLQGLATLGGAAPAPATAQNVSTAPTGGATGGWWAAPITQGYGPTTTELDGAYNGAAHFNKGLDFGVAEGTPIQAIVGGQVIASGDQGDGWGVSVKVRDIYGNVHNFGHLSNANVNVGDQIQIGQVVGASGNTGKSTGPHLSYDVMNPAGEWIDPSAFVQSAQASAASGLLVPTETVRQPIDPSLLGVYTERDVATLYDAARQAGFTGEALDRAVAVAIAESRSKGFGAENRAGENSIGPWQINLDAHWDKIPGATMAEKSAWLADPYNAAQVAHQISSAGTDFSPWSVTQESIVDGSGKTIQVGNPAEAVYQALVAAGGTSASPGGLSSIEPESELEGLTYKQWQDIVANDPSRMQDALAAIQKDYAGKYTPERIEYELQQFANSIQPLVPSAGARQRAQQPSDGMDTPNLGDTAAVQGGLQGMIAAFQAGTGRADTPSFGEMVAYFDQQPGAGSTSISLNPDPAREQNLNTLSTTGRLYRDQTYDGNGQPPTYAQQAQALKDMGDFESFQPNDRTLYDSSPDLFNGQSNSSIEAGGELIPLFGGALGLTVSPTDPGQSQRIAEALRSGGYAGAIESLQANDVTKLAETYNYAQQQEGTSPVDYAAIAADRGYGVKLGPDGFYINVPGKDPVGPFETATAAEVQAGLLAYRAATTQDKPGGSFVTGERGNFYSGRGLATQRPSVLQGNSNTSGNGTITPRPTRPPVTPPTTPPVVTPPPVVPPATQTIQQQVTPQSYVGAPVYNTFEQAVNTPAPVVAPVAAAPSPPQLTPFEQQVNSQQVEAQRRKRRQYAGAFR